MNDLKSKLQIILVPLGSCAANKTKYQLHSAYLIEIIYENEKIYQILLDAGNKRILNKNGINSEGYINPKLLKTILISHSHIDHTLYLHELLNCIIKSNLDFNEPIKIIIHKNAWKKYKKFKSILLLLKFNKPNFGLIEQSSKIQFILPNILARNKNNFNFNYFSTIKVENLRIKLNDFEFIVVEIKATNAIHNPNALAYRLNFKLNSSSASNSTYMDLFSFIYSPDTRFDSYNLVEFAKDSDYWLLDSTFNEKYLEKHKHKIKLTHSSPKYSAILCEKSNTKNYIFAHYYWKRFTNDFGKIEEIVKPQISKYFKNNVVISKDLIKIKLF